MIVVESRGGKTLGFAKDKKTPGQEELELFVATRVRHAEEKLDGISPRTLRRGKLGKARKELAQARRIAEAAPRVRDLDYTKDHQGNEGVKGQVSGPAIPQQFSRRLVTGDFPWLIRTAKGHYSGLMTVVHQGHRDDVELSEPQARKFLDQALPPLRIRATLEIEAAQRRKAALEATPKPQVQ